MRVLAASLVLISMAVAQFTEVSRAPRFLDQFSTGFMMEDGARAAAAPECRDGLGWVYFNGHCYLFTSYHESYLNAEERCNEQGAYLADVLDQAENDFIKSVLRAVNPKDGTDYWLGAMDIDRDKDMQWLSGKPMTFTNWKNDKEPEGNPWLHMNFDADFAWDTKDDANDKGNFSKLSFHNNNHSQTTASSARSQSLNWILD